MSHFVDRLTFFRAKRETYCQGYGITTNESRAWEDAYRKRWPPTRSCARPMA